MIDEIKGGIYEPVMLQIGSLVAWKWPAFLRFEVASSQEGVEPYVVFAVPYELGSLILCNCKGFKFRGECRHADAVAEAQQEWREVPGLDGKYEVNADGLVRSWVQKGPGGFRLKEPLVLSPTVNQAGYLVVGVTGRKMEKVHQLVLRTFLGYMPEGYHGCHWIGEKRNNTLANLRWATPKDNYQDNIRQGKQVNGERHHKAKMTDELVLEIRERYAKGVETQVELADEFGVHPTEIGFIVRGTSWKHVGGPRTLAGKGRKPVIAKPKT